MEKRYKVFLINLDRSSQRLEKAKQILDENEVEFERLAAVDGATLKQCEVEHIYQFNQPQSYYKELNYGEIGCYLSHRKAWERIVQEKLDFAIILEDDFVSCSGLRSAIETIRSIPMHWDYIKLTNHQRKRKPVSVIKKGEFDLCVFDKIPARTLAQAVSIKGAQKLLSSKKIYRPVDIQIQYWWENNLKTFGLLPPTIVPNMNLTSEIDADRTRASAKTKRLRQLKAQIVFNFKNRLLRKELISDLKTKL